MAFIHYGVSSVTCRLTKNLWVKGHDIIAYTQTCANTAATTTMVRYLTLAFVRFKHYQKALVLSDEIFIMLDKR